MAGSPAPGRLASFKLADVPLEIRWAAACQVPDPDAKRAALIPSRTTYWVSAAALERIVRKERELPVAPANPAS